MIRNLTHRTLREDSGRHWATSGDARPRQGRSGRMHHKTRFNPCERLRCTPSFSCDWRPLLTEQPPGTYLHTPTHTTHCTSLWRNAARTLKVPSAMTTKSEPQEGLEWPISWAAWGLLFIVRIPQEMEWEPQLCPPLPSCRKKWATDLRHTTLQG